MYIYIYIYIFIYLFIHLCIVLFVHYINNNLIINDVGIIVIIVPPKGYNNSNSYNSNRL